MNSPLGAARTETARCRDVPERDELHAWLLTAPVSADGSVLSWINHGHVGYPYEEAAGLYLRWSAQKAQTASEVVARRLAAAVSRGAAGRDGVDYLFDTAIVLEGLLAHSRATSEDYAAVSAKLVDTMLARIAARECVVAASHQIGSRWSTRWSPHLLKAIIPLREWQTITGDPRIFEALERLRGDFASPKALDSCSYVHAWCYAIEGCLYEHLIGEVQHEDLIGRAAIRLSRAQKPDGGLPAHFDDPVAPVRADATAQAVRIWAALDRRRFDQSIERALACLASLQHARGGVRYEPGSEDVNTWATLLTYQAVDWASGAIEPTSML